MGLFSSIFKGSSGNRSYKGRVNNKDASKRTVDIFTKTGSGKHVHQSYNQTISSRGSSYKEYHGGENSHDRGYNKG